MMPQIQNFLPNLLIPTFLILASTPLQAQITPDNTLGIEASRLTPNVLINGASSDRIDGGATRGSNLFHSFTEFNIDNGQKVYFGNPSGIENILTRVTGVNKSNILGKLGVDGAANLFLINPNGIVFGQNASLDVRGSFVGTTANGVQFSNQGNFSATNPQAPPLLTIQPTALLFNQIQVNAGITNQSQAPAGLNPNRDNTTGLRVADGQSLLLVGGNVNLDGGRIRAYDGRIELAGLAATANVGLNFSENNTPSLSVPNDVPRADISLTNLSATSVFGTKGGDIAIYARNLEISNSNLFAGIGIGLGNTSTQAGNITLNATGAIALGASTVNNWLFQNSSGNGGNITIDSSSFSLKNGAQLSTSTYGQGNAGNVTVVAKDAVSLADGDIISTVEAGGAGKGGNIDINAATLSLKDGAQLLTITREASGNQPAGRGNAGNVNVKVTGVVDIAGEKNGFSSAIFSSVKTGTVGNGGNITIDSGDFSLRDGARLEASTYREGNAGNVTVRAKGAVSLAKSNIVSKVEAGGLGEGGNIDIKADLVEVSDRNSSLSTDVNEGGTGKGGNLTIDTRRLVVKNAQVSASTFGKGDAGNLIVNASESVEVSGEIPGNQNGSPGGLFSQVDIKGEGRGGNLTITTGRLSVSDGSKVQVATFGKGDAGNLSIQASEIDVFETPKYNYYLTGIIADVTTDPKTVNPPKGNGGNLKIDTGKLTINGGQVSADTRGLGNAGSLFVKASDLVEVLGSPETEMESFLSADVYSGATGNGGNLTIETPRLSVRNGGRVSTTTAGQGNAGILQINANESVQVFGKSPNGQSKSQISAAVTKDSTGIGGNLTINTAKLIVSDVGTVSVSSEGTRQAGNLEINAPFISLDNQGAIAGTTTSGNGGNINLNSDLLLLRRGGQISTNAGTAELGGDGGNININSKFIVAVLKENSDITANAFSGKGGNINISTQGIFGIEARPKPSDATNDITASSQLGVQGQITITQPEVQPTQGLIKLPDERIDASNQLGQICPRESYAKKKKPLGEFVVSGHGSLPPSPLQLMTGTPNLIPLANLEGQTSARGGGDAVTRRDAEITPVINNGSSAIIEAQGFARTPEGKIIIVAYAPKATPSSRPTAAACPTSN